MDESYQETLKQQRKDLDAARQAAVDNIQRELAKNLAEASQREGKLAVELEAFKTTSEQLSAEAARALAQIFFDSGDSEDTRLAAKELLLQGLSARDAVATLINRKSHLIHTHQFRSARRLIQPEVPFPLVKELKKSLGELTILDIGSEIIDEGDIYGPLAEHWACRIVGFDPFVEKDLQSNGQNAPGKASARSYEVETLPNFVGEGGEATFHINKFGPTSSLKDTNHDLADRFGLLGEALKTEETVKVETHKLDDLLASRSSEPEHYDFLKIDVQGSTFDVLKGAKKALNKTLVCQLEAEFSELYLGEKLFPEIYNIMSRAGFELIDLCNLGHERYGIFDAVPQHAFHASRLLWADCIFMKRPEKVPAEDTAAPAPYGRDLPSDLQEVRFGCGSDR